MFSFSCVAVNFHISVLHVQWQKTVVHRNSTMVEGPKHQNYLEISCGLSKIVKLLGALPYSGNKSSKYDKCFIMYSYFLLSWYIVQIPVAIYPIVGFQLSIPTIGMTLRKLCDVSIPIIIIVQALSDEGKFLKSCLGDVNFAERCLHSVGLEADFTKAKHVLDSLFTATTIYFVVNAGITSYIFLYKSKFYFIKALIITVIDISHNIYGIYFTYYFCSILILFMFRFTNLNESIKALKKVRSEEGRILITVRPFDFDTIKRIQSVKFAHGIFRELILIHIKRYGIILAIQFVQSLTVITLSIYFLICIGLSNIRLEDIGFVIIAAMALIQYMLIIASIIICSTHTASDANNMEIVVHELINETDDKTTLQELEDFSLELYHGRMVFTANDFFTLDYSLFTKLAGGVASYLIIFLQFGTYDYQDLFDLSSNQTQLNNVANITN